MDRFSPRSFTLGDEEARFRNQPRLLRVHDDDCSPSTPMRTQFPLPNELLEFLLGYIIYDYNESSRDVLSFLLTCRACDEPEFQRYLHRTVYFAPNPKTLAKLKEIASDPVLAKLVKTMVYKDAAPRRLEVAEMERIGLSYRDRDFHRPCTHDWETSPCLWPSWWEDHNWAWIDKLINLEEVCYRPSRSMHPVSVDRPLTGHSLSSSISLRTETNVSLPRIHMSRQQLYRSAEGNIVVPPSNLAKSFPLQYTCAKAQIKQSMNIFYALTKYVGDCRREQLQGVTINFNTLGFIGRPTERMHFPHITTLEYIFDSGDISTAHVNSSLDLTLLCNGYAMPGSGLCPNIRHPLLKH
jgi:hypothetical protein